MIKAHEIQGCIALENSFNRVGLDHVVLVKVASTAVVAQMLGLTRDEIINAVSLAWVDGQSLRTYRHAPNTGSRKSWAAGDATSRAVRLALIAKTGEMGYPSVLTAKTWGFYDVLFKGNAVQVPAALRQLRDGERAVQDLLPGRVPRADRGRVRDDAAPQLARVGKTAADIEKITIRTHEACIRIIDKKGPLDNPADRDHCIQYMVAVPLIFGRLTAADYEDDVAADPRIDALREKIVCVEDPQFTRDYHDPEKRSIANALTVEFNDGSKLKEVVVEYPIGHKRRRKEGIPVLVEKFRTNLARRFPAKQQQAILDVALDAKAARGDAGARVRRPDGDLMTRPGTRPARSFQPSPAAAFAFALVAAAALAAAPAAAQDYPKLKAGLWEMTSTTSQAPDEPAKSTCCVDDSVQKEMAEHRRGHAQGHVLASRRSKRDGNRYVGESELHARQHDDDISQS